MIADLPDKTEVKAYCGLTRQQAALYEKVVRELEEQFGPEYETWVAELGQARDLLMSETMDGEARRKLLHELAGREALASRNASGREGSN